MAAKIDRTEKIYRQISLHSPRTPLAQRSTEAQRRLIARLIVTTGVRWDDESPTPLTVYRASALIDTLRHYEDNGGYAAYLASQNT